jgi:biopolymer transport protein ExbB/TolQ
VSRINQLAEWLLRSPLVWGGVACLAFYAMLSQKIIDSALLEQYCARHNIEKIEVSVFFVGLAALVMRCIAQVAQLQSFDKVVLDPIPVERQKVDECGRLLAQLQELPGRVQHSLLARRLWDAIAYVRRKGTANDLEKHLHHLEELDAANISAGYTLVRIIVWAIPILGLLGTVIGITLAVANLDPQALEESTAKVTAGLGIAFDHTATALALTMILMFAKSGVERVDDYLLARVNSRASQELTGRFCETDHGQDPNLLSIRRMSEQMLSAVGALTERQADVWKSTFHETQRQWIDVSKAAGSVVKESFASAVNEGLERHAKLLNEGVLQHAERLSASATQSVEKLDRGAQDTVERLRDGLEKLAELLVESLQRHGEVLTTSEQELAQENRRHLSEVEAALGEAMVVSSDRQENLIRQSENLLKEMQISLVEAAAATVRQQEQLVKQSDILLQVVDRTGQIKKLETSLNENLSTLRQGYQFEEMALNLSAAIQLLCARLGHLPAQGKTIDVRHDDRISHAA